MYILLLLMLACNIQAQESYVIDSLCVGSERVYRIDGEKGSTWQWFIRDTLGNTIDNPPYVDFSRVNTPGDTIWGSEARYLWDSIGVFDVSVLQFSIHGCDTIEQGRVKVFDLPFATAGRDIDLCKTGIITIVRDSAANYRNLLWTTSGDGTFDSNRRLHPVYTLGPGDSIAGTIYLTLTAYGLAANNTCEPAVDEMRIRYSNPKVTFDVNHLLCYNDRSGSVTATASGGIPDYHYEWSGPDGFSATGSTITGLSAGWYKVVVTDAIMCSVTDSVEITEPPMLLADFYPENAELCENDTVHLRSTITGGKGLYTLLWTGTGSVYLDDNTSATPVFGNSPGGVFELIMTVTDENGCTAADTGSIIVHPVERDTVQLTACENELPVPWRSHFLDTAGFWSDTLTSVYGCDSIITAELIVYPVERDTVQLVACENELPYKWNGRDLTLPGAYSDTLKTIHGCDSILVADFIIYPVERDSIQLTACENELPVSWRGQWLDKDGFYSDTLQSIHGCDSIFVAGLQIYPVERDSTSHLVACENELPVEWRGQWLDSAGFYSDTLTSVNGCDSIFVADLIVYPVERDTVQLIACENELPVLWRGISLDTAGFWTDTLTSVYGCDSIFVAGLIIYPVERDSIQIIACENELPYIWQSQTLTVTGIYVDTLKTIHGCDSILVADFIVYPVERDSIQLTACENELPYPWQGLVLNGPGFYADTLKTVNGCDSILVAEFFVYPVERDTVQLTACENQLPLVWRNIPIDTAGFWSDTLTSVNGCDSVFVAELIVYPVERDSILLTACENELPVPWRGMSLDTAGFWSDTLTSVYGCDSIFVAELIIYPVERDSIQIFACENELPYSWNGRDLTLPGFYSDTLKTIHGCDSILVAEMTIFPVQRDSIQLTACENELPFAWNTQALSVPGFYADTLKSVYGCDSILVAEFLVYPVERDTVQLTACENQLPIPWRGMSLDTAGFWSDTLTSVYGCDSIFVAELIVFPVARDSVQLIACENELPVSWRSRSLNSAGFYADTLTSVQGCDSIFVAELIIQKLQAVDVRIFANKNNICPGDIVNFNAEPENGGPNPVYKWFVNGVAVPGVTGDVYSYAPANNDEIYAILTSDAVCTLNNPATSNTITIIVTDKLPVSVSIVSDLTAVCEGEKVLFTATPVNGGINPAYAWFVNGVEIPGETGATFEYAPQNGDRVTAQLTSDISCATGNPALSNEIIIQVTDQLVVSVSITADRVTVNQGEQVTFTATPVNGGAVPYYQWFVNGTEIAGENSSLFTYTPNDGDEVYAVLTSDLGCAANNPATSNIIRITVIPPPPVNLFLSPELQHILCFGDRNGFIKLNISGGSGSYLVEWDHNGAADTELYDLGAGKYKVTVTDELDPTLTKDTIIEITSPAELKVVLAGKVDVLDNPLPIGSINITVTGGTKNYTFLWVGPNGKTWNTEDISGLEAGNYSLVVTDANGCETTLSVVIEGYGLSCPPDIFVDCSILNAPAPYASAAEYKAAGGKMTGLKEETFKVVGPDVSNGKKYCEEIFIRTYAAQNTNDEWIYCSQNIFIRDNVAPKIDLPRKRITCPDDLAFLPRYQSKAQFERDYSLFGNKNTASDNCTLDWNSLKYLNEDKSGTRCNQTIIRYYEIKDMCGNRSVGREIITVIDTIAPSLYGEVELPDFLADCDIPEPYENYDEFDPERKLVFEQCGNIFMRNIVPDIIISGDTIYRKYQFSDECGNLSEIYPQRIILRGAVKTVFDPMGPYCQNSPSIPLPTTSKNGITGTWTPAFIDTKTPGEQTYLFTPDDGQCASNFTMEIEIIPEMLPVFNLANQLCINSVAPLLSGVSENNITGTWNPAIIDTKTAGTKNYTFTPDAGQCAVDTTISIEITDKIIPLFAAIGPYCRNTVAPSLPALSQNGIKGTWVPDTILTQNAGIIPVKFIPDAGQCAAEIVMNVEILPEITPVFALSGPFCLNSTAPALPVISEDGITGTWNPSEIDTKTEGTTDYIFTPDAGQCALPYTLSITIDDEIKPVFAPIGPLCQFGPAPALPSISLNGVSGTWTPKVIDTKTAGFFNFVFTPTSGDCAIPDTLIIEITPQVTPEFDQIGPLCINSNPPKLPLVSNNGIAGTWSPATIDTKTMGTQKYLFTPALVYCAVPVTIDITIGDKVTPVFADFGIICPESTPPALPLISDNGIRGTWIPDTISTDKQGTFSFVFTPDANQCAEGLTMDIEISDIIPPEAKCRNTMVYLDEHGKASITAEQINNNSTDNCAIDTLFLDRYTFDCSDVGINPVILTVIDKVTLQDQCTANVTVIDTVKPVVACNGPFEIQLDENAEYKLTVGEVATIYPADACGIDTVYVFPHELDCDHIGLTTITLAAVGVNGDTAYCQTVVEIFGNRPPNVLPDSAETDENTPIEIDVVANDSDEKTNIDISSQRIVIQPKWGTVVRNPINGVITYTPNKNFNGVDILQYEICDDGIPCEPECGRTYVYIKVNSINETPVAENDYLSAECSSVSQNLLWNDSDPDNDVLTINTNPLVPPQHGVAIIDADGMLNYFPNDGFIGRDSLQYVICDNGIPTLCDTAWVYIDVDCSEENQNPIECILFVPEGFSPNGDGIHEFFRVMCMHLYPDATMRIFNRNGNLLWMKENYGNYDVWGDSQNAWWWGNTDYRWDQSNRSVPGQEGKLVKVGNYVWVLELGNGEIKNGTVMVAY